MVRDRCGGRCVPVQAAQQRLDVQILWLGRLLVGLVVDGEVVKDIRIARTVITVHAAQPVADDVRDLVTPGRVVGHHRGVGRGEQLGVPVVVLQTLTDQRGTPSGGAEQESAGHLVARRPQAIAGALEAEHRVEDVDRDQRLVVRGIRRAGRSERRGRAGFVYALVQDLALLAFPVGQHQLSVDGSVELPVRVVDLLLGEH